MADQLYCYHCGEAIPQGLDIHSQINGEERYFCCHACLGVAELIQGSGLAGYYRTRTSLSNRPVTQINDKHWQSYDIPQIAEQYVYQSADDQAEIYLGIDGIHCASCSWLIKRALEQKLHLEDVRVNATTARAEIHWNPQNTKLSQILSSIAELGYKPDLLSPDKQNEQFRIKRQKSLMRIIVAGLGAMQVMMFAVGLYFSVRVGIESEYAALLKWVSLIVASVVYFYSGYPFTRNALIGLKHRYINMDVPIATALAGAYFASVYHTLIGRGEIYFDSVTMFIFFILIGRHLELITRHKAALSQQQFAKLLPDAVYLCDENDEKQEHKLVPLATVQPGNTLYIPATRTIPVDGILQRGETRIDESMLTGESTPVYKKMGDKVIAGSTNLSSPIWVRVEKTGQQTILAGIGRMIEQARQQKSAIIEKTDAIAKWAVISILLIAAFGYILWQWIDAARAFEIALAILVASCPCALSLATPAALTSALNAAGKEGIIIKNSHTLDKLPLIDHIVFDKTGTLTQGNFQLCEQHIADKDPTQVWRICKALEANSTHPIAWYFTQQPVEPAPLYEIAHISGKGIRGQDKKHQYAIGSHDFIRSCFNSHTLPQPEQIGSRLSGQ